MQTRNNRPTNFKLKFKKIKSVGEILLKRFLCYDYLYKIGHPDNDIKNRREKPFSLFYVRLSCKIVI